MHSYMLRLLAALFVLGLSYGGCAESIRVATFNLWVGGDACGLGTTEALAAQVKAVHAARADVVGLQEQMATSASQAQRLAEELGWNVHVISSSRAILSRYPLEPLPVVRPQPESHHRGSGEVAQAAYVLHPSGKRVAVGVVHLISAPYQPYEIVDGNLRTADEAERSARITRLHELESLLENLEPAQEANVPVVALGDFNEPSHLDWTTATVAARKDPSIPFAVVWPTSSLMQEKGFVDTYRAVHPDAMATPGYTWTVPGPHQRRVEVMDRIDLIYVRGAAEAKSSEIFGEEGPISDIAISPWPTDHRGVVTEILLK